MTEAVAHAIARVLGHAPDHVELVPTMEYNEVYRARLRDEEIFFKTHDEYPIAMESTVYARAAAGGVPVPELLHVGLDGDGFGAPFFITRAAKGVPAHTLELEPAQQRALFEDLAQCLRALHAIDIDGFGWFELQALQRGRLKGRLTDGRGTVRNDNGALDHLVANGLLDEKTAAGVRAKQGAGAELFTGSIAALLHADLGLDHVYVDPVNIRVTAIIDWGDSYAGDVVHEFVPMAVHAPDQFGMLRSAYAPTDPLFDRKVELGVLLRLVGEARWVHQRAPLSPWRLERIKELARA